MRMMATSTEDLHSRSPSSALRIVFIPISLRCEVREFFRDWRDLDYQNRYRPVAIVEPLL